MTAWVVPLGRVVAVVLAAGLLAKTVLGPGREVQPEIRSIDSKEDASLRSVARKADAALLAVAQSAGRPVLPAVANSDRLLRRLHRAMVGSIPSLEELRAFDALRAEDPDHAIERWTDRLLRDRRFSDYLAERFSRAIVSALPAEPFFTYRRLRFVEWLSDQLQANRAWDDVVREIIDAEGLWTSKPATNFISGHNRDAIKLTVQSSRMFLGLRLDCAQCHDHPFSHWKLDDFRGLAAYFGQVQLDFRGITDRDGPATIEDPVSHESVQVEARVPFGQEFLPTEGRLRSRLATWLTHADNPYFSKAITNRVWKLMLGRGLIEPVDDLEAESPHRDLLGLLADDFRTHGYDLARLVRIIVRTDVFRRQSGLDQSTEPEDEAVFASFPVMRARPEQVINSLLQTNSLRTMDQSKPLLTRLIAFGQENDFLERYGDDPDQDMTDHRGNIPQRLLLMNGQVAGERVEAELLTAAGKLLALGTTDDELVTLLYRITVMREPTDPERKHFVKRLSVDSREERKQATENLLWALINSTEFSWNG